MILIILIIDSALPSVQFYNATQDVLDTNMADKKRIKPAQHENHWQDSKSHNSSHR